MKRAAKIMALGLASILICMSLTGCGAGRQGASTEDSGPTIRLAIQYGMQYAPVYVMEKMGYLEQLLPGVKIEQISLGGGSAMNEALISGSLDVAFMGIPPALIAMDSGAAYRIACGICVPPTELMVSADSGIASLADLDKAGLTIAVPSIGSIQNIMLAIACKAQLGDKSALDDNLVAMSNTDAYAAFQTGSVTAHFASMPYIAYEQNDGMVPILDADDCGGGSSIVCVCTEDMHGNEEVYNALLKALQMAIDLINKQDDEALRIIAGAESCTEDEIREYLNWQGTLYTEDVYSLTRIGEFMAESGYLKNSFQGFGSYTWDGAAEGEQGADAGK